MIIVTWDLKIQGILGYKWVFFYPANKVWFTEDSQTIRVKEWYPRMIYSFFI